MKKALLSLTLAIAASLFVASALYAQTNLLSNSDMETQGAWIVNQCEPGGAFTVNFGASGSTPDGGSGNSVGLSFASDGANIAEVFVYQPVKIIQGNTYKFGAAMLDVSAALTDSWIGISYVTTEPIDGQNIEETAVSLFGTWQDCNGIGFDGLIDTSCAAGENSYFQIPDDLGTDTIYFGINVGTWGNTCDIELYFDNVTLVDSADVGSGIYNPEAAAPSFLIYPNPSPDGIVNIEYNRSPSALTTYSVFNLLGEEILQGTFSGQKTLDLTGLTKGFYFIRIKNKGVLETEKLLLE